MLRKITLLTVMVLGSVSACLGQGNTVMLKFAGAPAGACSFIMLGLNGATGALSTCPAGVWVAVGGGGGGTVNANNGIAGAVAFYTAAGGSTTVGPTSGLSVDAVGNMTLVQGTITTSNSFISSTKTWNAAGVAFTDFISNITCTAAATASIAAGWGVAGTTWQMKFNGATCTSPQLIVPPGTGATAPAIAPSDSVTSGISWASGALLISQSGTIKFDFTGVTGLAGSGGIWAWSSNANPAAAGADTGLSRSAADVTAIGNGNAADTSGRVKAAGYMSVGTTFTGNAGCSETTLTGGATAGKFTAVSTSCTIVITMGNSATAPNGWDCHTIDLTTLADVTNPHQTATTTTTATIVTGTIVSGDVIQFSCIGY